MLEKKKFYINGAWVQPSSHTECAVIDPSTEETCAVITLGNDHDTDQAVAAAKSAFSAWSHTAPAERLRLVEKLLDVLLAGFVLPQTKTTVLQDWMKGRHSEVDDINGLVVEAHARHGGKAPVNAAVVELAHRIERGELEAGPQNLDALKRLAGM